MTEKEKAWANFYDRGTPFILLMALLLTVGAAFLAKNLTLDSELERLLPESAKSVQGLERLEQAYGRQIGRLAVVVEGPTRETNQKFVEDLTDHLVDHELVQDVEATRPTDFFKQRRLMYLELEDAREVAKRVDKRITWEKKRANPMFVSLGDDDPPEVDLSDIEEKYGDQFSNQQYLRNEDGTRYVIYVDPAFPNTRFKKTQQLVRDIEEFSEDQFASSDDELSIAFSGRYMKFFEQQEAITKDLTRGTSIALLGIILFLFIYFRSILYPIVIAIPLVASTVWSFAWAEMVFGSLNILTGFMGAVLMGLGIDYGIHIVSSFQEARSGHTPKEALITALETAGRPSLYAGLTTLVALGSLAYSSFQAFFEFGILSMGGLALILLSYALVLPCLLLLIADTRLEPDPRMPAEDQHLQVTPDKKQKWLRVGTGSLAVLGLLAMFGIPQVGFEFDFRKLMPAELPSFQVEDKVDEIVDMAQPPAVVLVDDKAHALAVESEIRRRMEEDPRADIIADVFSVYGFVPDAQQEKLEIWKEIHEDFKKVSSERRKKNEELQSFYEELQTVVKGGEITVEDLPMSVQQKFQRSDDPSKTVVLILPDHYIHDANDALQYVSVTSNLPGANGEGTVDPISQEALLADILEHVEEDTVWLVGIAIFGLLIVAFLAFRDVRRVLFAVA
ncbi:MAG: efflux RND transporter permease subunit, partial [Myxococcota bacterium]